MDGDLERRWQLVLPHRDRLLRLARGLVADPGDAEACVQEALTRCVTFDGLDEANVVAFLVATTRRLCMDHHRGRARDHRLAARLSGRVTVEPPPEEAVCDRAEAAWVHERLADLPQRQRAVALARASGLSPQEIADRLAVSYKTVETLLYRVRTRARLELERAYSAVLLLALRRPRGAGPAVAATSVAVVAGATLLLNPSGPPARASVPPPPVVVTAAPPSVGPRLSPTPVAAAAPTPAPPRSADPTRSPRSGSPTSNPTTPVTRCPEPPYLEGACASPEPSPTALLRPLDCVLYGIDRESGFQCRRSPTPTPTGAGEEHYGGQG